MQSNAHCGTVLKKLTQLPEQQSKEEGGNWPFDHLK